MKLSKVEHKALRKEANKEWSRRLAQKEDKAVDGYKWDPNPQHSVYYQVQLCKYFEGDDAKNWETFQESLKVPLPTVFRLGWACPFLMKERICRLMHQEYKTMTGRFVEIRGSIVKNDIVKSLPWFLPTVENLWQCVADSSTIKHDEAFSSLSDLLVREAELGHIVRQELASMIPALCLKVRHNHRVLDICAAPGSKTEQILSMMRADAPPGSNGACQGLVVGNDADPVRVHTLRKRYDRCRSPNLLLTCSRAEDLSECILSYMSSHQHEATPDNTLFDRIVADVPCSGDGTIRKFPHIYRLFRPRYSLDLHSVQLQIAKSAVELLKPGGRLVYSTCSLNPLEDEAVLCGLLRHYGPQRLAIVDISSQSENILPRLKARPGLSSWRIDQEVFLSGEKEENLEESMKRLPAVLPSMEPPSASEKEWMHLERAFRVLPHDMDCGGFFVAVLQLIGPRDNEVNAVASGSTHVADVPRRDNTILGETGLVDNTSIMKELGYNPRRGNLSAGNKTKGEISSKKKTGKRHRGTETGMGSEGRGDDQSGHPSVLMGVQLAKLCRQEEAGGGEKGDVSSVESILLQQLGLDPSLSGEGDSRDGAREGQRVVSLVHTVGGREHTGTSKRHKFDPMVTNARSSSFNSKNSSVGGDEINERGFLTCPKLSLVSSELYRVLCTWGAKREMNQRDVSIVSAGALMCNYEYHKGNPIAGPLEDNAACALASWLTSTHHGDAHSTQLSEPGKVNLVTSTIDAGPNILLVGIRAFAAVLQARLGPDNGTEAATTALQAEHPGFLDWCERHQVNGPTDKYVVLVLSLDEKVSSVDPTDNSIRHVDNADGSKRRLSKAEKKRLQKAGRPSQQLQRCQDGHNVPVLGHRSVSNSHECPSAHAPAAIVARVVFCDTCGRQLEGKLPLLEVITGADKCQSYKEMLLHT